MVRREAAASSNLYLVFPEPKPAVERRRWLLAILYLAPAAFLVPLVPALLRLDAPCEGAACALGLGRVRDLLIAYFFVGLASCVAFVWSLVQSYRHASSPAKRKQVQVVMFGGIATLCLAIGAIGGLTSFMTHVAAASRWPVWAFPGLYALTVLATIALPLSMAVAILKYKLWAVDRAVHRGLGFAFFGFTLIALYFVIAAWIRRGAGLAAPAPCSQELGLAYALAVTLLAGPLFLLSMKLADRFFGGDARYKKTLTRLTREVFPRRHLADLAEGLCESVVEELDASYGLVALKHEEKEYRLVGSTRLPAEKAETIFSTSAPLIQSIARSNPAPFGPEEHDDPPALTGIGLVVPIPRKDGLLGWLVLGERQSRKLFMMKDRETLATAASHASLAFEYSVALDKIEALSLDLRKEVARNRYEAEQKKELEGEPPPEEQVEEPARPNVQGGIVGILKGLKPAWEKVQKIAPADANVLLTGESGTGKEGAAKAIHDLSPRKDGPFVATNSAAIAKGLFESELCGHEKESFSGAVGKKRGLLELADGGTIFFDEIAEMSLDHQAKVLRIVQEGTFRSVGGTATIQVNVRIIAATNRDLAEEVERGRFRKDLYFRLNVLQVHLPALRERRSLSSGRSTRGPEPRWWRRRLTRTPPAGHRATRSIRPEM